MSHRTGTPSAQSNPADRARAAMKRRWAIYAALALAGVLVLAYFDGGEEPLRPIVHRIATPAAGGAA